MSVLTVFGGRPVNVMVVVVVVVREDEEEKEGSVSAF